MEGELAAERDRQAGDLEERLRKRRELKRAEAARRRQEKEEVENKEVNEQHRELQRDIEQIKQLIKPVMNEDARIEALLADEAVKADIMGRAIMRPETPEADADREAQAAAAHKKKLELISEEEDQKVQKLVDQVKSTVSKTLSD